MFRASNRRGFTLVELVAVCCATSLLGVQLVSEVAQTREAARRIQCKNNLKMIGLALHNYHDTFATFPVGWVGVDTNQSVPGVLGMNGWGWSSMVIPFMNQAPLYNQINYNERPEEPRNAKVVVTEIKEFRCPSDPFTKKTWIVKDSRDADVMETATSNYVGSFGSGGLTKCENLKVGEVCKGDGIFFHNSKLAIREILDGTSYTLLVGERASDGKADRMATWTGFAARGKSPFARILGTVEKPVSATDAISDTYSSPHDKGAQFVMCDGSVRFIFKDVDPETFKSISTRAGKDKVNDF